MKSKIILLFFVLAFASCRKEKQDRFSVCNEIIYSSCDGSGSAAYCLFGIQWDHTNSKQTQLSDSTVQTELTYAFMDSGYLFNTHSQEHVVSLSFDQVVHGTKQRIRDAFSEWASVAPLKFTETANDTKANIRIVLANISQGGLGYPPYANEPCNELAGLLVIRPIANPAGDAYYCLALHEMGHVLGLGHVRSDNVMNPEKYYYYRKLQPGDIRGIQTIYGKKRL
jgi:predicted Zn-dependent protease